jgi:hypothetical protein
MTFFCDAARIDGSNPLRLFLMVDAFAQRMFWSRPTVGNSSPSAATPQFPQPGMIL